MAFRTLSAGMSAGLIAAVAIAVLGPAGPGAARDDPPALPPLQVVVLVDESGSLSDADVVREREAARTIAFSVLAPRSEVSVVGFGSSDGAGQSAVDVVCRPTVLAGEQDRDALAACIAALHRRTPGEGADTDHAAALQQALSIVQTGPARKVVFLLTDGRLDVRNSPAYGDNGIRRQAAAQAGVDRALDRLEATRAQVWPLGFGSADPGALRAFARGRSCTPEAPDPRPRVVADSAQLTEVVAEAFTSAGCVKYGAPDVGNLPRGGTEELHVDIPAIASDASILVYKRDARVQVEYRAPGSSKSAPDEGGTAFQFAGQSTETESVRISDPVPGRWTIVLSSANVAAKDVAATVVYQAAVKAVIGIDPPQPVPGQTVGVEMQVWARNKAITDAEAIRGLTFVVTLSGAGVQPRQLPLEDAGRNGVFSGRVTVPASATGALTFTGQVSGIGIGGDTRTLSTRVQPAAAAIQGQILFDDNRATIVPGGELRGRISVRNDSGRPARLRFIVVDPSPDARLSPAEPLLTVAAGAQTIPFTLRVGADSPLGISSARLRVVDDADPAVVVAERLLATEIAPAPPWWFKLRWVWLGLAILLAIALVVVVFRLRSWRAARTVHGLVVELITDRGVTDRLDPPHPGATALRFVVVEEFGSVRLQAVSSGDQDVYEIRRCGNAVTFSRPGAKRRTVAEFGARTRIGPDRALVISDERGGAATSGAATAVDSNNPFGTGFPEPAIPVPRAETVAAPEPRAGDPFGGGSFDDPSNPFRNAGL